MAITAATKLSDFSGFVPAEIAQPYFDLAARMSAVQSITRQVPLGAAGQSVPVVTGKMAAAWVTEAGQKAASGGTMTLKSLTPQKIAAIAVVSQEVVRANPGNYINLIRPQIAEAFASAFDSAALHGTSTPFSQYLDETTKAAEIGAHAAADGGVHQDLVTAMRLLASDSKRLTGFLFDDIVEPHLAGSVDANGRPIYIDTPLTETAPSAADAAQLTRRGRTLGRETYMSDGVATTNLTTVVGYAGDWSQCVWGVVGGINYAVSTEASVTINGTLTSLWEYNLVAVRAEAEYGFLCNDTDSFVRLTNSTGS